jgi:hypothetical protein
VRRRIAPFGKSRECNGYRREVISVHQKDDIGPSILRGQPARQWRLNRAAPRFAICPNNAGLTQAGFQTVLLKTRHVKAALSAMTVKTDRKDACGLAQLLRMGWLQVVVIMQMVITSKYKLQADWHVKWKAVEIGGKITLTPP